MLKTNYNVTTIHKISIFPLGMINAFLLESSQGCILIDTGLPNTEKKIEDKLKELHKTFNDIKLIVITHAHIDHAGNAAKLKVLTNAKIIAHNGDLPYYRREKEMHFCSTGLFGWLFFKTGAIQQQYQKFEPDILINSNESFRLEKFGIEGEIISTPGHTEGSISVVIDNDRAVVGDLISSGILLGGIVRTKKAKRPPFEDDPLQVSQELQSIVNKGVKTFYMGHGGPLPKKEVLLHIDKLNNITKGAG